MAANLTPAALFVDAAAYHPVFACTAFSKRLIFRLAIHREHRHIRHGKSSCEPMVRDCRSALFERVNKSDRKRDPQTRHLGGGLEVTRQLGIDDT